MSADDTIGTIWQLMAKLGNANKAFWKKIISEGTPQPRRRSRNFWICRSWDPCEWRGMQQSFIGQLSRIPIRKAEKF
jgi:hypothetical protein